MATAIIFCLVSHHKRDTKRNTWTWYYCYWKMHRLLNSLLCVRALSVGIQFRYKNWCQYIKMKCQRLLFDRADRQGNIGITGGFFLLHSYSDLPVTESFLLSFQMIIIQLLPLIYPYEHSLKPNCSGRTQVSSVAVHVIPKGRASWRSVWPRLKGEHPKELHYTVKSLIPPAAQTPPSPSRAKCAAVMWGRRKEVNRS